MPDLQRLERPSVEDWGKDLVPEKREAPSPLPPNDRTVIAYPLDYSVQSIVAEATKTPARIYVDTYQRNYVWDNRKASLLIESLVLNVPIPAIYFSEDKDGRLSVIDGNQRITTLVRYLGNEFACSDTKVVPELQKRRFHQLDQNLQNHISTRGIRCITIDKRSHPEAKFDVFSRLNTSAAALNDQELRNCLQRGPFNELLHRLAAEPRWLELVGHKKPDKRMRDNELILRLFALSSDLEKYERPLHKFLTGYMETHRFAGNDEIASLRGLFARTVERGHDLLGSGVAFRRIGVEESARFIAAIFDAQMVALALVPETKRTQDEVVRFTLQSTQDDTEFMGWVLRGSSHAEILRARVRHYVNFFRG